MFRLIEPSSGQITKHSTDTFSECTHKCKCALTECTYLYYVLYFGLMMAQ
jgi:hypothetical protein